MLVVDASVTLAWLLEDETSSQADIILERLQEERAVVPTIWPFEVANALLVAERRGRIDAATQAAGFAMLRRLPLEVEACDVGRVFGAVFEAARIHRLTIYDAAYLELAQRERVPLATLDERLAEAARSAGVSVL